MNETITYKTKLGIKAHVPGNVYTIREEGKMIIYRPHRELFEDAMAEAKVFENDDAMKDYICSEWNYDGRQLISKEDIVIKDNPVNDPRNGWKDTRYVCTKRCGKEEYTVPQCIGMCAYDFPCNG